MSQTFNQNTASTFVALLVDGSGVPVTGLTYSSIVVKYKKYNASTFTTKTTVSGDVVEVGSGVYDIAFTAAELDTAGSFTIKISGGSIAQFVDIATVAVSSGASTPVTQSMCVVSGHVYTLGGVAVEGAVVTARVLGFPTVTNTVILTDNSMSVYTDENGQFDLTLVQGAFIDLSIPSTSYRRQLTVPSTSTANLLTIA